MDNISYGYRCFYKNRCGNSRDCDKELLVLLLLSHCSNRKNVILGPVFRIYHREVKELLVADRQVTTDNVQGAVPDTVFLAEEFGWLYEIYLPKIYQYTRYRVADIETAEDLTSDIFNKALDGFTKFNPEKAGFSTWIFSIARNTIIDYYRKHAKEIKVRKDTEPEITMASDSPEEQITRSEEIARLRECISKLNDNEQELISLKFSGGMTNREIAKITDFSESNVGTILCRAIRKLRDDFSGWYDER
jgi:RNA polymerase sigma-70 factor (ECF subfamily)